MARLTISACMMVFLAAAGCSLEQRAADGESGGGANGTEPTGSDASSPTDERPPVRTSCHVRYEVSASETWTREACPDGYIVGFQVVVRRGAELRVEPGTLVKMEEGGGLVVAEGAKLSALGTPEASVRFAGEAPRKGHWRSIEVWGEASFSHTTIEHAGSDANFTGLHSAALIVGSTIASARVALSDVVIRDNARFGLAVLGKGELDRFERVHLTGNDQGAADVEAPTLSQLRGTDIRFEGNGDGNVVRVRTASTLQVVKDAIWPALSPAVYRVFNLNGEMYGDGRLLIKAHVEIEPGAVFEFLGEIPGTSSLTSGIVVFGEQAGLKAIGTADRRIVFRGVPGGQWEGITFASTTWADNRLERVDVLGAKGGSSYILWKARKAGLVVGRDGTKPLPTSLTIKDVLISGVSPADVAVSNDATLIQQGTNVGAGGALDIEIF